jgi:type IV pilus assembly protein PilM
MKSKSFGLDIGTSSIKAVWLDHSGGASYSLISSGAFPTPAKGMLSESPLDQEEMAGSIRRVIHDAKIHPTSVNLALADNQVYTRVIEMPMLSEKELESAIYWEAEQYIPAPLPTLTLSKMVLGTVKNATGEQKMQILLVAAPTGLINRYSRVVEMAGLSVASVETELLSVIRSITSNRKLPISVLLHVGTLSTSLAILENNMVIFTYSMQLGGLAINRSIASDFGFSLQQAEEYKKTYGILDKNFGGKIGKAIEPILLAMITEIKKALTFYSERTSNQQAATQLILTGPSAKIPGLDLFFVQNTGLETVIVNPWVQLNITNVPKEVMDNGTEYAVSVGLALKEV